MKTQWISYPSVAESFFCQKMIIPSFGETWNPKTDSVFFQQGELTSIGNRSCTHVKVSSEIVPLDTKYLCKSFVDSRFPFLLFDTTGLPHSRWSTILTTISKRLVFTQDAGSYVIRRYFTVPVLRSGYVVTEEHMTKLYKNPTPSLDREYIRRREFTLSPLPTLKVTCKTTASDYANGIWTTTTYNEACLTGFVNNLAVNPPVNDARILWRSHGQEFLFRSSSCLPFRSWGELSAECVQKGDKAYQVSSAQYLLELGQLATLLSPYLELIRRGGNARRAASAWLSYYYGARLTAKDTYAQISGIIRRSQRAIMEYDTLRSRDVRNITLPDGTTISGYQALTVYHRSHVNWIVDTYRAMRRYGLNPSLSLAWDLVPLSFVVDWVAPIGDALAYFDGRTFEQSLQIIESLMTTKYVQVSKPSSLGLTGYAGSLTISIYQRRVISGSMPRSTFESKPVSFSGMNLINGTALVVQRRP